MNEIKVTYREQEIAYNETSDHWTCDLFSRPADTLKSAKERIDKKLDTEKKTPFQRFEIYTKEYRLSDGDRYSKATVTGVTDDGDAWVSNGKDRRKIDTSKAYNKRSIIPVNPHNSAIVEAIHAQKDIIEKANKEIEEAARKFKFWNPPTA